LDEVLTRKKSLIDVFEVVKEDGGNISDEVGNRSNAVGLSKNVEYRELIYVSDEEDFEDLDTTTAALNTKKAKSSLAVDHTLLEDRDAERFSIPHLHQTEPSYQTISLERLDGAGPSGFVHHHNNVQTEKNPSAKPSCSKWKVGTATSIH